MKLKNQSNELGKTGELLFKIFIIVFVVVMGFILIYASVKYTHSYFTSSDEKICKESNATLINGVCHSECNQPVNDKRNELLIIGIFFPIVAMLLVVYSILIFKKMFKKK